MSSPVIRSTVTCRHCGDICRNETTYIGELPFCCNGCKAVYELLHQAELCAYYDQDRLPGLKPISEGELSRFAYLDDPDTRARLIDFSDDKFSRVHFSIPQMHCASCIWLLENLYRVDDNVSRSQVNFLRREATILFDHRAMSLRQLVELLARLGYEPSISLDHLENRPARPFRKQLHLKIGIAGFCFGNIMLLSFPDYLSTGDLDGTIFPTIFRYAMLALSLPVLLYSARDYFTSAWRGLRSRVITIDFPLAIGLAALYGQSLFDIFNNAGPGYLDSFSGLVFFLLIGRLFQHRTYERLAFDRDYRAYFPAAITRKSSSGEETVPVTRLSVGDRIIVRNRELVPADAVLISGLGQIDYSFVSGESDPHLARSGDKIYAGGRQTGTAVELEIIREVSQSYLTSLWNTDAFQKPTSNTIVSLADRLGRYFTAAVLSLTAVTWLYWWSAANMMVATTIAVAVLIVACPCALALASPFILGSVLRVFGRHGLYLKNTAVAEAMAYIDSIVFDKTGTLTDSELDRVTFEGKQLSPNEQSLVRSLVRHSTHPVSRRLESCYADAALVAVTQFTEEPGQGIEGTIDGHTVRLGRAEWVCGPTSEIEAGANASYLAVDGQLRGRFLYGNTYRHGVDTELPLLKRRFEIAVLSGDTDRERPQLASIFGSDIHMSFQQTPHDKLSFIGRLREKNHAVLMVGDGLNDAGALQAANVGIAVSSQSTSFSPASDAILDAARLGTLPKFLELSRRGVRLIWASFLLSIIYNVVGLGFAVTGNLSPLVSAILMPLSSITVVAFATLMTRLAAKRVGL